MKLSTTLWYQMEYKYMITALITGLLGVRFA